MVVPVVCLAIVSAHCVYLLCPPIVKDSKNLSVAEYRIKIFKRLAQMSTPNIPVIVGVSQILQRLTDPLLGKEPVQLMVCLLYTSDAADE